MRSRSHERPPRKPAAIRRHSASGSWRAQRSAAIATRRSPTSKRSSPHPGETDPQLPEDVRAGIAELKQRYVSADHVVPGGANEALIEELGLVDYLARRFAITGTPDECKIQFQALADLGVECVFLNGAMRNEERMITSVAERVGVAFQASVAGLAETSATV
jgi:alkanesulfonate monooxygenase SsuD/methylene tetrahydromethanopterin reductase-like flavin-dependent oxidoreductase (luciferase family)